MSPSHRTAEESKADHIEGMGEELGRLYDALWQEVAWLHMKWREYATLFGTSPARVELLNKAAPSFFRVIQDSLWEDVLLHIARLTDSPRSMGKRNLSFRQFAKISLHPDIASKVEKLTTDALETSAFARDWRNRKLAHRDLHLALGQGAEPLAPVSRAQVKEALAALSAILNALAAHYLNSTTMFAVEATSGGAEALLYCIDDGLRFEDERHQRISRGEYQQDDLQHRSL
jgi:hypothetical protein